MSCDNNTFITGPEARMIARDSVTIFTEICAIQQAILSAIDNCESSGSYSVVIPTIDGPVAPEPELAMGTSTILDTSVDSAMTTADGSGYTPSASVYVEFELPTGEQAILGAAITDGVSITGVNIVSGGSGYTVGHEVIISTDGTAGTGATAIVKTVSDSGIILEIEITDPGIDYAYNAIATITSPATTAIGSIEVDEDGNILAGTEVTIDSGGSGYITDPTFTVPNSNDIDYTSMTFSPITPMTTVIDSNLDGLPDSNDYYLTHINQITSPEMTDQLAFVEKYFSDIGYNIQLRINPITMSTLQWQLSW